VRQTGLIKKEQKRYKIIYGTNQKSVGSKLTDKDTIVFIKKFFDEKRFFHESVKLVVSSENLKLIPKNLENKDILYNK
jgi:hypothetical protein